MECRKFQTVTSKRELQAIEKQENFENSTTIKVVSRKMKVMIIEYFQKKKNFINASF